MAARAKFFKRFAGASANELVSGDRKGREEKLPYVGQWVQ